MEDERGDTILDCFYSLDDFALTIFELIEDDNIDIEEIGELPEVDDVSAYDGLSIVANRIKINKLIQAVKQLNREIQELKER